MNAILPENLEEQTIGSMSTGEEAFTVPWAMWVDDRRRCWLHPQYTTRAQPGGTVQLRIVRQYDGYHVFVSDTKEKWQPQSNHGYAGSAGVDFIPVAELHAPGWC
jgi:hypothetical protein